MLYLTTAEAIDRAIEELVSFNILWLDTEVAHWDTPNPKLSLIQISYNLADRTGASVYIFDVLNLPDPVENFIDRIMSDPKIEKIFHNASFDLKYLGGKKRAKNVTCTYKIARKISKINLGTSNLKLKTLAGELCGFTDVDSEEQASDWGMRPLREKQLKYATMDVVYLAAVHQYLLAQKNRLIKPALNVTDVKLAFECPRLFYLSKKHGGKTLFLPVDRHKGIGTLFHKLAKDFITFAKEEYKFNSIFLPEAANLSLETVALEMQNLFYHSVFFPKYLQPVINNNSARSSILHTVWQGIAKLILRWAQLLIDNRKYCHADKLISTTFVSEETKLEHLFTLPDGTLQKINGRSDSIIYNMSRDRLCAIEFKTYDTADPSASLAQVALYSYIIKLDRGLSVDAAIYCVLPEFFEYNYSWQQLEDTVYKLIPHKLQQMHQWLTWKSSQPDPPPSTSKPHLCQICPQLEKCQSYFPVYSEAIDTHKDRFIPNIDTDRKQLNTAIDPNPNIPQELDLDKIGNNLVEILQSYKIDVDYLRSLVAPAFIRVKIKPHPGVKVDKIIKLAEDLKVQLGTENVPLIATQAGYVSVDLPRKDRETAFFNKYIKREKKPDDAALKIAIGVNLEGKLVEADLADPNTCHFLIGGTTGSGKSEFLRSILLSLIVRHTPQQLKVIIIDPKRITFPEFADLPWLLKPIVKERENALEIMEDLVTEMERRYKIFEKAKCSDIKKHNRTNKPEYRIVCIVDEYADLMVEKETKNVLESNIKTLGAKARAAGIHLIVATQRPDAKVVTPLIRANLPGRIGLKTASIHDSQIIFGGTETTAANLLGKGDLLYRDGGELQRLQSLLATDFDRI